MVRQWQTLTLSAVAHSQTTLDRGPDFVKLAEAYGIPGYRVTNQEEFAAAFQTALDCWSRPLSSTACWTWTRWFTPWSTAAVRITQFLLD